jgi:hypothetical protein
MNKTNFKKSAKKVALTFAGHAVRGVMKKELEKMPKADREFFEGCAKDAFKDVPATLSILGKLAEGIPTSTRREKYGLATKILPESSIKTGETAGKITNSAYAYQFRKHVKGMRDDMSYVGQWQQEGTVVSADDGQGVIEYPIVTTGLSAITDSSSSPFVAPVIKMTTNHIKASLPVPTGLTNPGATQRFYLEKIENEVTFKNNENHRVMLIIQELVPRHNLDYGTSPQWVTIDNQTYVGNASGTNEASALQTWRLGSVSGYSTQPGAVGSDPITPNVLNAKCTQSLSFNLNWNVMATRKVEMDGGSTHIHRSVYRPNYMLFDAVSRDFDQIAGVTPTLLITVHGLYGSDITKAKYASSKVSFGGLSKIYAYAPVGTQGITEFYDL